MGPFNRTTPTPSPDEEPDALQHLAACNPVDILNIAEAISDRSRG